MKEVSFDKETTVTSQITIYDDLLKIIEEAKVHNIHQDYFGCVQFEKAIERAKKEHDLLELYRKHMTTLCKNTREGVKDSMFSAEYVAYEVYQQIKALEGELKGKRG